MLDAKIASALNKIIEKSHFKKKVSLEKQKAQKEDRLLRGRQIAVMIYDYFRVTGAHDTVLDYADLFMMTNSGIRYKMGGSFIINVKNSIWWYLGKPVKFEDTWVCATQNRIGIQRHGGSSEDIGSQLSKVENHGEEEKRSETSITKLWRQAWEKWIRSSSQESKRINRRWRRKRYLLPMDRKRAVFARRPMQFPSRNQRSCTKTTTHCRHAFWANRITRSKCVEDEKYPRQK